jgi:hypothetical protein
MNSTAERPVEEAVSEVLPATQRAERGVEGRSPIEREKARGLLMFLESKMGQNKRAIFGDSEHLPIKSTFSNGLYLREIFIPKGWFVMGKIHKHEHPNILIKGKVVMITEEGPETIEGPHTMLSPAGIKRFLYTLEDTIWVTMHRTDFTTAMEAEADIIAPNYEDMGMEYEAILTKIKAGG